MKNLPSISIVVPSYNQVQYLPETLQSLVDQDYPKLEVIIQDGVSKDGSIEVAKKFFKQYPDIFKLYVEKDTGQADALNKGFKRTTGDILAFLNSDDTYYPGTLHRVAKEIDISLGRYIVMGRCLFTGENSPYVGVEHPADYKSHFDHLAIWKRGFNTIPQPSVFWHRQVWMRCGELDVKEQHALDYDLFCRFSQYYTFHRIDELFSTYRMHDASKSSQRTESEVLELAIGVSRKHWGTWLKPLRWRCEISHWMYSKQRHEHARHHARRASEALTRKNITQAMVQTVATFLMSPKLGLNRLVYAWTNEIGLKLLERVTAVNEEFSERYSDGWIGPVYRNVIKINKLEGTLLINFTHHPQKGHETTVIKIYVDNKLIIEEKIAASGSTEISKPINNIKNNKLEIVIKNDSSFVPAELFGGDDRRKLSVILNKIEVK